MAQLHMADHAIAFPLHVLRKNYYPEVALERLAAARVLLCGAGTLGCHIARSLLAWGVKDFVFVDHGTVSLTNPLRQPLYTHEDVGAPKAAAAAARLAALCPADYGLRARGVALSVVRACCWRARARAPRAGPSRGTPFPPPISPPPASAAPRRRTWPPSRR
jgi:hypothetical protein